MVNRKLATAFLSKAMQKILEELDKDGFLSKDREIFERLYSQVREHCEKMGDAENRQKILIRLYDSFFKIALPETSNITLNKSANFPQFVLIHTVNLEKDMVTHSSVLAWRILWTEEPGGLLSMGTHIVGHN